MKILLKFVVLILTYFSLQTQNTKAQCNIDDWFALRQLYLTTNGDNWNNKTGWEEVTGNSPTANCNLDNLYGVDLDGSGRVTCIHLDGVDDCGWNYNTTGNNLTGSIPQELGNLNHLTNLSLSTNKLSGGIPIELNNLTNLAYLRLDGNNLTGSIPTWLGNLTNLKGLWLSANKFSGSIPTQLGNLTKLNWLGLYCNQLTGGIPTELGNLTNLEGLGLDQNQLTGNIPTELGNLTKLKGLNLGNNQLTGSIPTSFSNLTNLERLWLHRNQLNENIPPAIGNLSNLTELYLHSNQFGGSIPFEIGNLNNLTILSLCCNQLSGSIPAQFVNLTNLSILNLCCNQLSGSIPTQFENLSNLTELQLQNNQLCGSILPGFGSLSNLETLQLSNNQLSGSLPPQLGNLNNLTLFEVYNNNLSDCYSYDINLLLCEQLIFPDDKEDGNYYISNGNNFDATWSQLCESGTGMGVCMSDTDVYPGDLNHDGIVNNQDVSLSGLFLYNSGPQRAPEHQNNQWYPHPASDWDILNSQNKDIKHHDCNGDGQIDENDQQAVEDNMGEVWDNTATLSNSTNPVPPCESDYQVLLHPIDQVYDGFLVMNVALERRAGGNLTLQSGYFTVDYSDVEGVFSQAGIIPLPTSWLGINEFNLWYESTELPAEKKIEVGFTKTNNTNSEGNGVIGQLILAYDNSSVLLSGTSDNIYEFRVSTVGVHNSNAQFTAIEDQILQVNVGNNNCQSNWTITTETPFQNEYKSNGNIKTEGLLIIGEKQQVKYQANRVTLKSGFRVKADAGFRAEFGSCN